MEVKNSFTPLRVFSNPHFQTIFPRYFSSKTLYSFSEDKIILKTSDSSSDRIVLKHNLPLSKNARYYIVMIHGMEGCSESHYLLRLAYYGLLRGFGIIRVNLRNCGDGLGIAKGSYHAGFTRDIEDILKYVYQNFSQNIILAGFSLSANTVLKYFGEERENYYAKVFSAVAPPLNLEKSCRFLDSKLRIYKNHFLKSLKYKIKKGYVAVQPYVLEKLDSVQTIFDFDSLVVTSLFGYKTAIEYYQKNSSEAFLHKIQNKGLVLQSIDDPVVLVEDWLKQKNLNPNLSFLLSRKGGHVGFSFDSYFFRKKCWLSETLLNYYESMI